MDARRRKLMSEEQAMMTPKQKKEAEKLAKYLGEQFSLYMKMFVPRRVNIGWSPVALATFTVGTLRALKPDSVSWEEFFSYYLEIMQKAGKIIADSKMGDHKDDDTA